MKNQKEVWRQVKGYEGIYEISSFGRVKSLGRYVYYNNSRNYERQKRKVKEIFLKPKTGKDGYKKIECCSVGQTKTKKIHQLVAIAFLNHTPNGNGGKTLIIDHIDNDKLNNNVSNLQLTTSRVNNSKDKNGICDHTGVYLNTTGVKPFYASININGKHKYLGSFNDKKEAHKAYLNAIPK